MLGADDEFEKAIRESSESLQTAFSQASLSLRSECEVKVMPI